MIALSWLEQCYGLERRNLQKVGSSAFDPQVRVLKEIVEEKKVTVPSCLISRPRERRYWCYPTLELVQLAECGEECRFARMAG